MKDKDIQLLIDKYLEGATSPEEEKWLAKELSRQDIPLEWKVIRMMLGELTMGESAYDHIMVERQALSSTKSPTKCWKWVAAMAVAASLALFLLLAWPKEQEDNHLLTVTEHTIMMVGDTKEDTHDESADEHLATMEQSPTPNTVNDTKKASTMRGNSPSIAQKPTPSVQVVVPISNNLYEDTLGNGIWQSEKNIVLAVEILNDCEKTIRKSGQNIRNEVIEASFHALPQRPNIKLVIDEEGDYVIADDTKPSPVRL